MLTKRGRTACLVEFNGMPNRGEIQYLAESKNSEAKLRVQGAASNVERKGFNVRGLVYVDIRLFVRASIT